MLKTTEKIYNIVPLIATKHDVDLLLHYRTAKGQDDYDSAIELTGPWEQVHLVNFEYAKKMAREYSLIIFDNSLFKEGIEYQLFMRLTKGSRTLIIGCPHGNRSYHKSQVDKRFKHAYGPSIYGMNLGVLYDYCFVLGNKDKRELVERGHRADRILPGGIPSNDVLKTLPQRKKHILVIPSHIAKGPTNKLRDRPKMHTIGMDEFIKTGVLNISEQTGCPVIFKTKSDISPYMKDNLLNFPNVKCVTGCTSISEFNRNNQLVADSRFVISIPSTMAFKSIQLGIPTVILKGTGKHLFGQIGCFEDFPGLIHDLNEKQINRELYRQENDEIRFDTFLQDVLEGGSDFNSTATYVRYIESFNV